MKIRALTMGTIDYILDSQKDDEDKIIFILKPLSARQQAISTDNLEIDYSARGISKLKKEAEKLEAGEVDEESAGKIMQSIKNFNQYLLTVLSYGLVGWSNFLDVNDNEVPFSKNQEDNLNRLPKDITMELSMKILDLSTLKEDEVKNL